MNGADHYRDYFARGCRFDPDEKEEVLALNAGRKIHVRHKDGYVTVIYAVTGRNPWDRADSWRKADGTFSGPVRGGKKVMDVLEELGRQIEQGGLAQALAYYGSRSVCCICGANLTDPESILRGIGPECVKKVQAKRIMELVFGQ